MMKNSRKESTKMAILFERANTVVNMIFSRILVRIAIFLDFKNTGVLVSPPLLGIQISLR